MSFVRNSWYVAGWSHEFADGLFPLEITGQRIVMFRGSSGKLSALEDPERANVHSFPVEERHGVVWVWMGDPSLADASKIFDIPEMSDASWHMHHGGHLHINAHYLNVTENGGFTGDVDRWHYYDLHLPSTAVIDFGSIDSTENCPEDERNRGVRVFAIHFVTPINEDETVDHWMHIRNTAAEQSANAKIDGLLEVAFAEDKAILEAVHEEEKRPQTRRPVRIAIDKGPTVYRKRIREMIEAETVDHLGEPIAPVFVDEDKKTNGEKTYET